MSVNKSNARLMCCLQCVYVFLANLILAGQCISRSVCVDCDFVPDKSKSGIQLLHTRQYGHDGTPHGRRRFKTNKSQKEKKSILTLKMFKIPGSRAVATHCTYTKSGL